jgi:predicted transcriptional regulator
MLRNLVSPIRRFSNVISVPISAYDVFQNSCYNKINFKIHECSPIQYAINRFTGDNIGCLAVTNDYDKVVGVLSERDYIQKAAFTKKHIENIKVMDICSPLHELVVVKKNEPINVCINKMIFRDVRHIILTDDNDSKFIGIISIKDLMKEINKKNCDVYNRVSDFYVGKGGYFSSE